MPSDRHGLLLVDRAGTGSETVCVRERDYDELPLLEVELEEFFRGRSPNTRVCRLFSAALVEPVWTSPNC